MSIRDLLLNLLIGFGVMAFAILVATIDSLPLWILLILAALVWAAYVVIVIRDHTRDIRYPIVRYRPKNEQLPARVPRPLQTVPYNQEEDKE